MDDRWVRRFVRRCIRGRAAVMPSYPNVSIADVSIAGPHGVVPARRYVPAEPSGVGFVWVHGGAFVSGDLDIAEAEWVSRVIASRGISVVSLDYRKAVDGVTFPVPSDDVLAGWRWAVDHSAELGVDASRFHLGGASAGGNLVAGVTMRCRDGQGPLPASLVLVYSVLHDKVPPPSAELAAAIAKSGAVRFTPDVCDGININYVGDPTLLSHPYAFPANGDVTGFPRTYVLNSELDDLRPSGEAFAEHLRAARVAVVVEFQPGAQHGHLTTWIGPQVGNSIDRIVAWLMT